jgi:hypothetical protein
MKFSFIHFFLLSGNDSSGGIVQLIIFAVFIVAMVIKNLAIAKKQQNQQQKGPNTRPTVHKTKVSHSFEKARIHQERVEQFLESIFQTKKVPDQHPSRPSSQKNQSIVASVPSGSETTNVPDISQSPNNLNSDEVLGVSIMDLPSIDTAISTNLEQIPELKEETIQEDQQHLIIHDKPQQSIDKKSLNILSSLSDSDDLKRAILYSEILGKPVSMKEY